MAEVVIAEWSASGRDEGDVTFADIDRAIFEGGVPREAVRLRLSLDFDSVIEDDDNPLPVLQLVRDETVAERKARERLQAELVRKKAATDFDDVLSSTEIPEANARILSNEELDTLLKSRGRA